MPERWHQSDNPTTVVGGATWRIVVTALAITAVFAAVSVGVWWLRVATSDIKGRGDATRTVNSGDNRLAQQAYFEQTYADIKAADLNLDLPGDDTQRAGRTAYCRRLVADYNAAARTQRSDAFRSADLPAQISTADPATDCEANQ